MNKSWENIYFLEELRYVISGKGYTLIATLLAIILLSEIFLYNL